MEITWTYLYLGWEIPVWDMLIIQRCNTSSVTASFSAKSFLNAAIIHFFGVIMIGTEKAL